MKSNAFGNFAMAAMLAAVVFFGIAIVNSIDNFRASVEKVSEKIDGLASKLKQSPPSPQTAAKTEQAKPAAPAEPVANYQYFDQNADFGGRLIIPVMAETRNMNAIVNNESFVSDIWARTYDSLTERDYAHPERFEPKLATSWELSADKMTYTINIRPGVLWHDFTDPVSGKVWTDVEVTAADFKFYVDVIKDETVDAQPARVSLQDLAGVEVVSKYCFKVHWSNKYFKSESMTLGLMPLPRHLYHAYDGPFDGKKFNDDFARNKIVVGCGPYRFERWEAGKRLVLKRWEKYFGAKLGVAPPLDTIVFEVIKHPNTQLQALLSNKVDRMGLLAEQWVNSINTPPFDPKSPQCRLKTFKYPSPAYSYIGYNMRLPIFQDKRVRRALTHLVNRERILKDVYHGLGRVVSGSFFIDSPYCDKSIAPYEFSVAKAKELFKQAGWTDSDGDGVLDKDGKPFKFAMLAIASSTNQEKFLPIIKEDMEKAGVVMDIVKVEWSVYTQRLEKKDFDACCLAWTTSPFDPDPSQIWQAAEADKPMSSNHVGFKNAKADELIAKIRVCFDFDERVKLCHEFDRVLHEEQPYTFLFTPDALLAQRASYRNAQLFTGLSEVPATIMWLPADQQLPLP